MSHTNYMTELHKHCISIWRLKLNFWYTKNRNGWNFDFILLWLSLEISQVVPFRIASHIIMVIRWASYFIIEVSSSLLLLGYTCGFGTITYTAKLWRVYCIFINSDVAINNCVIQVLLHNLPQILCWFLVNNNNMNELFLSEI